MEGALGVGADSCNSTDKDKSSPEDGDADSDGYSGLLSLHHRPSAPSTSGETEAKVFSLSPYVELLYSMSKKNLLKNRRKWTRSDKLNFGSQVAGSSCSSSLQEQPVAAVDPAAAVAAAAAASAVSAALPVLPLATTVTLTVANKSGQVFGELRPLDDPLEILFARAEGLHAHGHSAEACELGVQLATELLAHPPDLMVCFFKHYFTLFHFCSFRSL